MKLKQVVAALAFFASLSFTLNPELADSTYEKNKEKAKTVLNVLWQKSPYDDVLFQLNRDGVCVFTMLSQMTKQYYKLLYESQ